MQKTKYEVKQVGQPEIVAKAREGKWQVTVMKFNKVKTPVNDSDRDFIPEQDFSQTRVCVQYSRFDKRTQRWNNQSIWVNDRLELIDLKHVLENLSDCFLEEVRARLGKPQATVSNTEALEVEEIEVV